MTSASTSSALCILCGEHPRDPTSKTCEECAANAVDILERNAHIIASYQELRDALDYLLEQTVDQDLAYGIELTEGEREARGKALAALAKTAGEEGEEDDPVCPDCHWHRSDAEGDEGWNPDCGYCFSCVESVYRLCEKFGITATEEEAGDDDDDLLDVLRRKLWAAREEGPLRDRILACLTFREG
jgi:hypothetical protein